VDLVATFREMSRPSIEDGSDTFSIEPIAGAHRHFLGKDGAGGPALLLQVLDSDGELPGPIILQHVIAQHGVRCRLSGKNAESTEETVTLVRCVSSERVLREYFVRVSELAARQLGESPSRQAVNRTIRQLTELFRAFEIPTRKSVQGLWAELLVIDSAANPESMIRYWHVDPEEAFDFSETGNRLEVKSFGGQGRLHRFALRQIRPQGQVDVLIASVRAERSTGGATIADLLASIHGRGISADSGLKLDAVVASSLGDVAASALALPFDLQRGRESIRFFDARVVPSIDPILPSGVFNVKFDALLDETRALAFTELHARSALFASSIPRT
jgi:hypothetical protein